MSDKSVVSTSVAAKGLLFFSYSRRDKDAVRGLVDALGAGGRKVWIDWKDIPPTAAWKNELEEAIVKADVVIFAITPHSVASTECGHELALAARFNKKIVPLVLQRTPPESLPDPIRAIQWIDLVDDFQGGLRQLDIALDTDLPWVRDHTRLLVRAREWEASNRDNGLLLGGSDLTRAEAWFAGSAGKEPPPIPLQGELILSSRRRATAVQRALLVSISAALVITAALGVATYIQSRERERQRQIAVAKQMGAQSVLVRDQRGSGLLVSALLAAESTRRLIGLEDSSIEGAQTLVQALQLLPRRVHWLDHSTPVRDVRLDSTGTWLVTAAGRTVRVWRVSSGELHKQLEHELPVAAVSIDDTASYLLARQGSAATATCILWDLGSGRRVELPSPTLRPEFAVMSPSGRVYALADSDTVEIYALPVPSLLRRVSAPGQISELRFMPDDALQIDSATELERRRGNTPRQVQVTRETHHGDQMMSTFSVTVNTAGPAAAFRLDPQRRYLITSSTVLSQTAALTPTSLQLWEAAAAPGDLDDADQEPESGAPSSGKEQFVRRSALNFDRGILSLRFSPDGSRFVTASGDYRVQVWQTSSGRELQRVEHGRTANAASLARVKAGTGSASAMDLMVTGGADGYAGVWQTTTALIGRGDVNRSRQVTRAMRFSDDGHLLAVSTTSGFELWDVNDGVLLARRAHRYGMSQISNQTPSFHPHARTPVFVNNDQLVVVPGLTATSVFDRAGQFQREMSYGSANVVALSAAGDTVAVASNDRVEVLRVADGATLGEWEHPRTRELVIDRHSRYLAALGGERMSAFDVRDRRPLDVTRFGNPAAAAFSSDGRFATADAAVVRIYDISTSFSDAALVGELRPPAVPLEQDGATRPLSISAIAFSPDGRLLAASWGNQALTLWDVTSRMQVLHEPIEQFQSLVFSPDGSRVAVFGSNVPIRVWDGLERRTPREVLRIPHRENVRTMTFSTDGRVLASASSDDVIALSPVALPDLLAQTTQRLPRNLTREEWAFFLGDEPYRCTVPALSDCRQAPDVK